MSDSIDRRRFLGVVAATGLSAGPAAWTAADAAGERKADAGPRFSRPFLTEASDFVDVSRGKPKPFTLRGEALQKARLTPETWRLEIVGDGSSDVAQPARLEDGTALDLDALEDMGKAHGVKYLKAMQCNNIPFPLGQGLWEGVPLREVLHRVGKVGERPPDLLLGVSQRRPGSALPVLARLQPCTGDAPMGAAAAARLPTQRPGHPSGARRACPHGYPVGARVQIDQMAAADRPDQRLQGQ